MNYRRFASTEIYLSEIALGTMHFKWIISEKESLNLLDNYSELGGNIIDTSDMYTLWQKGFKGGEAESIIGKWFTLKKNRNQIFLTTKVRARMWEGSDGEGLGRAHILRACDESLKRLRTDHIDLYMAHWPDPNTPIEETTLAYQELINQGKIRFVGLSNYSAKELTEALLIGEKFNVKYLCIEPYYNLLSRFPFEDDVLPLVKKYKLAVTPYSPLAGGFLTGIYKKNKKLPDNVRSSFAKEKMSDKNFALIDILDNIGRRYNRTVAEVSIAWLLHHPWITAPIVGPETIEQLMENIRASSFRLDREDIKNIDNFTCS